MKTAKTIHKLDVNGFEVRLPGRTKKGLIDFLCDLIVAVAGGLDDGKVNSLCRIARILMDGMNSEERMRFKTQETEELKQLVIRAERAALAGKARVAADRHHVEYDMAGGSRSKN